MMSVAADESAHSLHGDDTAAARPALPALPSLAPASHDSQVGDASQSSAATSRPSPFEEGEVVVDTNNPSSLPLLPALPASSSSSAAPTDTLNSNESSGGQSSRLQRRMTYGVHFLNDLAHRLHVIQFTVATGCLFYHRYFQPHDISCFSDSDVYMLAAASLFLASKVEETPKKLKDVVVATHHLLSNPPRHPTSEEYGRLLDRILHFEMDLVVTLGFELSPPSPHRILTAIAKSFRCSNHVIRTAWGFLNDSLFVPLCVFHHARHIALACLVLATVHTNEPLPDDIGRCRWWEAEQTTLQELNEIIQEILGVYEDHETRRAHSSHNHHHHHHHQPSNSHHHSQQSSSSRTSSEVSAPSKSPSTSSQISSNQ